MPNLSLLLTLFIALGFQDPAPKPADELPFQIVPWPEELPKSPEAYLGRKIARTMHWQGAPWLLRATRESEEHATRLLEVLGVKAGWTVCDFGCGNGFHTLPLAKQVGDEGKVVAVDIQKEMLALLLGRARESKVENLVYVANSPIDPGLKKNTCDLILLVDVYHELSYPEQTLAKLRLALKDKGQLVLVEFRSEDEKVPIKPEHKMSKEQILKELVPNGFRLVRAYDDLPWQHVMFFERAPLPAKPDVAPRSDPQQGERKKNDVFECAARTR